MTEGELRAEMGSPGGGPSLWLEELGESGDARPSRGKEGKGSGRAGEEYVMWEDLRPLEEMLIVAPPENPLTWAGHT